jgi:glycosyltransferase involved in cell wall biosynthesis
MVRVLFWLDRTLLRPETRLHRFLVGHWFAVRLAVLLLTLCVYPLVCVLSWLRLAVMKLTFQRPRIIFGPTPIISIVEQSTLLRELGYDSRTLVYTVYFITDKFDYNLTPLVRNQAIGPWLPNVVFLWSLLRFDIFHFFFDGGLWSGMNIVPPAKWLELPLLRLAGKRIIAAAYGADVRVRTLSEMWLPYNLCRECPEPGRHCVCDAGKHRRRMKHNRDWCNVQLAMGDMHDYVFGSRRDFYYWPIDTRQVTYVGAKPHDGPVRIVHSPNHRHFKGTKYIEAAVAALQAKGYQVELDIVERVPNDEAKRRYAAADIVIPQCVAGWIGYTEIEAMAAGKPVMAYIRNPAYLSRSPDCPLVNVTPDTLEREIERLLREPQRREELGRLGREYVERYWSYEGLASDYHRLHQEVWQHNNLLAALRQIWHDVVHGETGYRVGRPLQGPVLKEWPIYSNPVLNLQRIHSGCYGQPPLDDQGIPRMIYNGQYVEHPGVVSLYGLNHWHMMLRDDVPDPASHRQGFLTAVRWLRDHLQIDDAGVGRWLYPFNCVGRDLKSSWCSCFSQGLGISLLLRAAQEFPEEEWWGALHAAVKLFRVPVKDFGVLCEENGLLFLEEYPEPDPAHVLNGMLTAMFALQEYHRVTGEAWVRETFDRCALTMRRVLGDYESAAGLRYDLKGQSVVNWDYYYFIVQQVWVLHRMTGDDVFRRYARRWRGHLYRGLLQAVKKQMLS